MPCSRYVGPEGKLKFAYDKINLEAFENDEELSDENYTIFVSNDEEEEKGIGVYKVY